MLDTIKYIAFDADDTLWENENHYQEFQHNFCEMLSKYAPKEKVNQKLYETEMKNLPIYGYGAKSMTLSMIETICNITKGAGRLQKVQKVIELSQKLLQHPVILLNHVEEVLQVLNKDYKLVLATRNA